MSSNSSKPLGLGWIWFFWRSPCRACRLTGEACCSWRWIFRKPISSTRCPSTFPVSKKRTSRSRPTTTCRWCEVKAPGAREERSGFSRVELSYGSFQCALNLPDDANQDSKREASAPKHGRSIPIEAESDISIAVATKSHQETRCRGLRPSSSQ